MKKLIREPLVHFLIIGAGLFLLYAWKVNPAALQGGSQSDTIIVAQETINQLVAAFTRTWMRPPTAGEVDNLIENHIRDEIYYREAVAVGLDRGDAMIRRKLRQKMEFILEDIAAQSEPTDAELQNFMQEHPEKYRVDPQISFRQVYVNADRKGANAEERARLILEQLRNGTEPDSLGDQSLIAFPTALTSLWDIEKQFGEAFGKQLLQLPPGQWVGPVRSGFGLHLIYVEESVAGRIPALDDVRDRVKRDWGVALQAKLKDD
ncbi:MAG: peptidylprolyl isomerase, partial [Desulfuromonadales bacterium]